MNLDKDVSILGAVQCACNYESVRGRKWEWKLKGVLHHWTLFSKTLYIFLKNKAPLDKVSNRSD